MTQASDLPDESGNRTSADLGGWRVASTRIESVELRAVVPSSLLGVLEPILWLLSPNGVLTEDAACLDSRDLHPDDCRVSIYVPVAEADGAAATMRAQLDRLGVTAPLQRRDVTAQDWNAEWKKHFKAFQIGKSIRIEPSWAREPEEPGILRIAIDPGLAFGTGTHETTRLAVQAVHAWAKAQLSAGRDLSPCTCLDVGTGSAILAILAVKLGVGFAIGTEIDEDAVDSAQANLVLNDVADRISLRLLEDPAELGPARFDLVIANIISSVLLPMRPGLVDRMAPGGDLVLSGILAREVGTVRDAYLGSGLLLVGHGLDGEWASLTFRRTA